MPLTCLLCQTHSNTLKFLLVFCITAARRLRLCELGESRLGHGSPPRPLRNVHPKHNTETILVRYCSLSPALGRWKTWMLEKTVQYVTLTFGEVTSLYIGACNNSKNMQRHRLDLIGKYYANMGYCATMPCARASLHGRQALRQCVTPSRKSPAHHAIHFPTSEAQVSKLVGRL